MTEKPEETLILYAAAAYEVALDGPGRNGVFTKYLLAHLREPGWLCVAKQRFAKVRERLAPALSSYKVSLAALVGCST